MPTREYLSLNQESIENGWLVTLNGKEKIYFETIEEQQIFFRIWRSDNSLSIKECLKSAKEELANNTILKS